MTGDERDGIIRERMEGWARQLAAEHATPALLVGIGHDHHSGQLVICCTEGVSDTELGALLIRTVRHLQEAQL